MARSPPQCQQPGPGPQAKLLRASPEGHPVLPPAPRGASDDPAGEAQRNMQGKGLSYFIASSHPPLGLQSLTLPFYSPLCYHLPRLTGTWKGCVDDPPFHRLTCMRDATSNPSPTAPAQGHILQTPSAAHTAQEDVCPQTSHKRFAW